MAMVSLNTNKTRTTTTIVNKTEINDTKYIWPWCRWTQIKLEPQLPQVFIAYLFLVLYTLFKTRCSTFALAKKVKICSTSKNKNTTALKQTSRVSTLSWHIYLHKNVYFYIHCINHTITFYARFQRIVSKNRSRHLSRTILY